MNSPLEIRKVRLRGLQRRPLVTVAGSRECDYRFGSATGMIRRWNDAKSACADPAAGRVRHSRHLRVRNQVTTAFTHGLPH
jgi:hypothetical protein